MTAANEMPLRCVHGEIDSKVVQFLLYRSPLDQSFQYRPVA